jgi:mannose-6-phosphate isomerase-like protein (cupin superfamily)
MNNMNRREVCIGLSAFMALAGIGMPAIADDEKGKGTKDKKENVLSHSETFPYDQLPVTKEPGGHVMRRVLSGVLATGEFIEVHESTLPAGDMPHPPHKHRNSEILFIRDGKLEFLNDGKPEPVGPGGVVFTASNVMHGLRNVGDTPANYFVVAIGRAEEGR